MPTATNLRPRPFDRATNAPLVLHPDLLAMEGHDGYDDLLDFIGDLVATACVECDNDLDVAFALRDDALCVVCHGEAVADAWRHDAYDRAGDR